ncbi:MAG: glycosyltransferase family 39 protein [Dehalococcoidia bacterium]
MSGRGAATSRAGRAASDLASGVRGARPWRSLTFWLIIGVNIALAGLYVWSRGGATTHLRIETDDAGYRAYVDGRLIADTPYDAAGAGGIAISLPGDQVPSLPSPSGIGSVRVTDLARGDVVLDEAFDGAPSDRWSTTTGEWSTDSGVYGTSSAGFLTTDAFDWGAYAVDLELRNATIATVRLWQEDGDSITLKIWPYRRFDSRVTISEGGSTTREFAGQRLALERRETIKSIAAMVLRPYPLALVVIAGAIAIALAVRQARLDTYLRDAGRTVAESSDALIGIVVGSTLVLLWYINYVVADAIPHVPDSVAYIFQAKTFASFHVTADPPPVAPSFVFFKPPFLHIVDGRWFSQYPFGHPLFLAIGERLGAIWLVPPILGAASLFLIYRLGVHVYGVATGLLAALLLFFSPFFQMTASDYMSHNTAVFVVLMCLFLLRRPSKRRALSMFFAGIFVGLLFNMRPLVATAFVPILGALMLYELWRAGDDRAKVFREDLALAAGGLVMLLAYFAYNQATTGDFLASPQTLTLGDTSQWFGFSGGHSVTNGLQNQQLLLALMLLVANGWPAAIGLLFAALPFLLGTRNRWDYFLGAAFLALASANIFYKNPAVMHGPRFWYETMPFLMLLSARGATMLVERAGGAADWLAARLDWRPQTSGTAVAGLAIFGLVAGLTASSAHGWMLEQRNLWSNIEYMPQRISMLDGFNSTDRRLLDRADEMDLDNALVFVAPCRDWWCYGSVFWANSPSLDGTIVWAQQTLTDADAELVGFYPERELYLADYTKDTLQPTTLQELQDIAQEAQAQKESTR